MSASGRPARSCASRTRRARSPCSSWVPWEKLSRAASMPAATSRSTIARRRGGGADRADDLRAAQPVGHSAHVSGRAVVLLRRLSDRSAGTPTSPGRRPRRPAPPRSGGAGCTWRRGRVREGAPVLICPTPVATARSAMVVSSVSPERCDMTAAYPFARRELDRLERLGERPDLVHLDEDRVGDSLLDPAPEAARRWSRRGRRRPAAPARRAAR